MSSSSPPKQCTHLDTSEETAKHHSKIKDFCKTKSIRKKCSGCHSSTTTHLLICLECYHIGCFSETKSHAEEHAAHEKHPIGVSSSNPSLIYCFACDQEYRLDTSSRPQQSSSQFEPVLSLLQSPFLMNKHKSGGVTGLTNLGNTCFMNAALQCLVHLPPLIEMFSQPDFVHMSRRRRGSNASRVFYKLIHNIWSNEARVLSPKEIFHECMTLFPQFHGYGQHDSHEFIRSFLDHLHEELKFDRLVRIEEYKIEEPEPQPDSSSSSEQDQSSPSSSPPDTTTVTKTRTRRITRMVSPISDLFETKIESHVTCERCRNVSATLDSLMDFSVEIPSRDQMDRTTSERAHAAIAHENAQANTSWYTSILSTIGLTSGSVPLDLCLHSFVTSEDLNFGDSRDDRDNNLYFCEKCNRKVEASKKLVIKNAPEILMIHIKRFSHSSFWSSGAKVNTHVTFEADDFEFKNFLDEDDDDVRDGRIRTKYDLYGVVRHMGGTGGGHYIAYARHGGRNEWFRFDDRRVERVSADEVMNSQAYVLFYVKKPNGRHKKDEVDWVSELLKSNDRYLTEDSASSNSPFQISRYWFHKLRTMSYPLHITARELDTDWLSCYHGNTLPSVHGKRELFGVVIAPEVYTSLLDKFGGKGVMMEHESKEKENDQRDESNDSDGDSDLTSIEKDEAGRPVILNAKWKLKNRAEECDECDREEMLARRDWEKQEIRRLEHDRSGSRRGRNGMSSTYKCYLSMEWANAWRAFVHGESDEIPPPIDNAPLLLGEDEIDDDGDTEMDDGKDWPDEVDVNVMKRLRKDLKQEDFLVVTLNIWKFLIAIYGGGPMVMYTEEAEEDRRRSNYGRRDERRYRDERDRNQQPPPPPKKQSPRVRKSRPEPPKSVRRYRHEVQDDDDDDIDMGP